MSDKNVEEPEVGEQTPDVSPVLVSEKARGNGPDDAATAEMRQKSRRSFLVGGIAALAAVGGWRWLRTRREIEGLAWPLRLSHEFNEQVSRDYFSQARLAPTFPVEMAREPRINGSEGLDQDFDPSQWTLEIVGLANPPETALVEKSSNDSKDSAAKKLQASPPDVQENDESSTDDQEDTESDDGDKTDNAEGTETEPDVALTLDQIKQLPRVEMVTQLKCIEGWSVIVRWTGARLADLMVKYPPNTRSGDDPDVLHRPDDLVRYISLETPGAGYYVGLDVESALHPQTLLCYEMNGQPLTLEHGAPLRLVTPLKYGIKNIKRIGRITFSDIRPADYWAERGYDWYSGH